MFKIKDRLLTEKIFQIFTCSELLHRTETNKIKVNLFDGICYYVYPKISPSSQLKVIMFRYTDGISNNSGRNSQGFGFDVHI